MDVSPPRADEPEGPGPCRIGVELSTGRELDWEVSTFGRYRHALAFVGANKATVFSFTARTRLGLNLGIMLRTWWWNRRRRCG